MKFKSKTWIGWLIFATISWPLLAPRYTPLQSVLAILFSYITVRLIGPKATPIRMFLQLAMIVVIIFYVVWTLDILWGI